MQPPASRINELLDDGRIQPWYDSTQEADDAPHRRLPQRLVRALGIDVASSGWSSIGSAVVSFDAASNQFRSVEAPAIAWPNAPLTVDALASTIDAYVKKNGISAVAIDGPQGWRDPDTPPTAPGVGRRCEYECRTPGKTGLYPTTFPGNQREWIEFSVDLFDALLQKEGVRLADPDRVGSAPFNGYFLLECFPTSAWRSSGLRPLPAKSKRPGLPSYVASLATTYGLPSSTESVTSHDDLQAIVGALVAAAVVGGPAIPIHCGSASTTVDSRDGVRHRVEGFIWNVRPLSAATPNPPALSSVPVLTSDVTEPAVRVTQGVIAQVARGIANQEQIALRNFPSGTRNARVTVSFEMGGDEYTLVIGDAHAAWRAQQDAASLQSFDTLFAILSDTPNSWHVVRRTASPSR